MLCRPHNGIEKIMRCQYATATHARAKRQKPHFYMGLHRFKIVAKNWRNSIARQTHAGDREQAEDNQCHRSNKSLASFVIGDGDVFKRRYARTIWCGACRMEDSP
jgi:hypothetical protein